MKQALLLFPFALLAAERVSDGNVGVFVSARKVKVAEPVVVTVKLPKVVYKSVQFENERVTSDDEDLPAWVASKFKESSLPAEIQLRREVNYYKPGSYVLPAVTLQLSTVDEKLVEYTLPEVGIEVGSLLPQGANQQNEPETFDVADIRMTYTRLLWAIGGALLLGVLLFFLWKYLRRRFEARKEAPAAVVEELAPYQAWDEFVKQAQALSGQYAGSDLVSSSGALQGAFLTLLMRLYHFDAANYTSMQLVRKLGQRVEMSSDQQQALLSLMDVWLLYKYARKDPHIDNIVAEHELCMSIASKLYRSVKESHAVV